MSLIRFAFAVGVLVTLSACASVTPPQYSMSADNNLILRKLEGASAGIVSYTEPADFDAGCRMVADIRASGNRTVGQFVMDSFNDELKFAGINDGLNPRSKLHLTLDKVAFSSSSGLSNGWWDMTVTLRNVATNASVTASSRHDFPTAFEGVQACNQTGLALTPAVQGLIKQTIQQRDFRRLISATQ